MKTEKEKIQIKELTDTILVSWCDYLHFSIKPHLNDNRKVSFVVSGYQLDEAIQAFYENPKIPILSFCNSYKKIRSMLFNMRVST